MKGLLKIFSFLLIIGVVICGIFFGKMALMGNDLKKDLQELESYDFELQYHISGDSDILNMTQYETEETPIITRWFASYMKKMEQGGSIKGEMRDDVYHANVYAEGETQSSIDFYYKDQAVFGVKETLNYIIASAVKETDLPISLLQNVTPDGYITLEQIKTVLGVSAAENTDNQKTKAGANIDTSTEETRTAQVDLVELGSNLIGELKLVIPTTVKDNYFQLQLDGVDMSYCLAKTSLNGEEVKLSVGISNETYHKYVYIRIDDVYGKEGSTLEALLHINVTENETIEIPETISDGVINTLAEMVSLLNRLAKQN